MFACLIFLSLLSDCTAAAPPDNRMERLTVKFDAAPINKPAGQAEIVGVRATLGNAVDCPTIQDDVGKIHAVSFLSAAIPLGGRVSVSGFYAVSTRCNGTVLVVESETALSGQAEDTKTR